MRYLSYMKKLKESLKRIINIKNISILVILAIAGLVCYTAGYEESYQDNVIEPAKKHNIPQRCVATHNYCITLSAVIKDLRLERLSCIRELEQVKKKMKEEKE